MEASCIIPLTDLFHPEKKGISEMYDKKTCEYGNKIRETHRTMTNNCVRS